VLNLSGKFAAEPDGSGQTNRGCGKIEVLFLASVGAFFKD
jgi:hypothetical protein